MDEDNHRVIHICNMLDANNKIRQRISDGEENVPDFNRPQNEAKRGVKNDK